MEKVVGAVRASPLFLYTYGLVGMAQFEHRGPG